MPNIVGILVAVVGREVGGGCRGPWWAEKWGGDAEAHDGQRGGGRRMPKPMVGREVGPRCGGLMVAREVGPRCGDHVVDREVGTTVRRVRGGHRDGGHGAEAPLPAERCDEGTGAPGVNRASILEGASIL